MDHEQFVEFCILLGCDYCDTIKMIGKEKAYNLIRNSESLTDIIKKQTKPLEKEHIKKLKKAKKYFIKGMTITPIEPDKYIWKKINTEELINLLFNEYNFDLLKLKKTIHNLNNNYKKLNINVENNISIKTNSESVSLSLFLDE